MKEGSTDTENKNERLKVMITNAPRGTEDWYGERMYKRECMEEICRNAAKTMCIKQIETPMFEHTQLFSRGVGETTDVVQKEMYTFEDKGGRSISLKPEGTAGVIRAYIEHGMFAEGGLKKFYYFTPAFRYEKPQSGRLREHHQFGVEYIGSGDALVEVELITLVTRILKDVGLKGFKVHINSIGCADCRKDYNKALLDYLNAHRDSLCSACRERMERNPLRVLDCKNPECREVVKNAPRTIEYLDDECRAHFEELKSLLKDTGIEFEVDTGIVRGLDYYTRTVFEFVSEEGLTLCGGGRYDRLVHDIDDKRDIPAAGFGLGLERLLYFTDLQNVDPGNDPAPDIFIGILGDAKAYAFNIVNSLREKGIRAETEYLSRSVKAMMKYANKTGIRYVTIIGENEISTGKVKIKNMETGTEEEVEIGRIDEWL